MTDIRVEAIRADPVIGIGTCSVVDECYTDAEIVEILDYRGITDPAVAVVDFRATHDVWHEVADEIRRA